MAKDTVKLAGPDSHDNYRVLATKGTLTVRPGELLSERYVKLRLLDQSTKRRIDTTVVAPKYEGVEAGRKTFVGEARDVTC